MSSVSQSLVLQSAPQRCSIIEALPNACFDSVASAFAISAFNSLRNSSSSSSSRVHPSLTQRQGGKLPKCLPSNLHNILFGRVTSFFVIPGSNACRNVPLPCPSRVDSSMTPRCQEPLPGYLPKDLFGIILSYSGIEVREECYTINGWQKFAWQGFSWAELGPKLTIFDEKAWEMHVDLEAHELDFTGLKSLINIEGNVPNTVAAIRQVHKMLSWENKRGSRRTDTGKVTLLNASLT